MDEDCSHNVVYALYDSPRDFADGDRQPNIVLLRQKQSERKRGFASERTKEKKTYKA